MINFYRLIDLQTKALDGKIAEILTRSSKADDADWPEIKRLLNDLWVLLRERNPHV